MVKVSKLLTNKKAGQLIVRAMIACNDDMTLKYFNLKCDQENPELSYDTSQFMRHQTIRMIMMHMTESREIIHSIIAAQAFQSVIASVHVKDALEQIRPILRNGDEEELFKNRIRFIRDKFGAHYDERAVQMSMEIRAKDGRRNLGKIQLSSQPFETRFLVAEDVITTALTRLAWGLTSEGSELEAEADAISDWFVERSNQIQGFSLRFLMECGDRQFFN